MTLIVCLSASRPHGLRLQVQSGGKRVFAVLSMHHDVLAVADAAIAQCRISPPSSCIFDAQQCEPSPLTHVLHVADALFRISADDAQRLADALHIEVLP